MLAISGRYTGINGKVEPELGAAKAGGFERWRMINAGRGEPMRMRLYRLDPTAPPLRTVRGEEQIGWRERYCSGQPLPMWEIALDGLTRSAVRRTDQAVLFGRTQGRARPPAGSRPLLRRQRHGAGQSRKIRSFKPLKNGGDG